MRWDVLGRRRRSRRGSLLCGLQVLLRCITILCSLVMLVDTAGYFILIGTQLSIGLTPLIAACLTLAISTTLLLGREALEFFWLRAGLLVALLVDLVLWPLALGITVWRMRTMLGLQPARTPVAKPFEHWIAEERVEEGEDMDAVEVVVAVVFVGSFIIESLVAVEAVCLSLTCLASSWQKHGARRSPDLEKTESLKGPGASDAAAETSAAARSGAVGGLRSDPTPPDSLVALPTPTSRSSDSILASGHAGVKRISSAG